MWEYNQIPDNNDYLMHYGVLGMKWGVRRNRSQARVKAANKTKKLKDKVKKSEDRLEKANAKLEKRLNKRNVAGKVVTATIRKGLVGNTLARSLDPEVRAVKGVKKARRQLKKSNKKLSKWESAVDREFDPNRLMAIDQKQKERAAKKKSKGKKKKR